MVYWNFHSLNDNTIFHRRQSSPLIDIRCYLKKNTQHNPFATVTIKTFKIFSFFHHWNAPPLIPILSSFSLIDIHQNISGKTTTPPKMHPKKEPWHNKTLLRNKTHNVHNLQANKQRKNNHRNLYFPFPSPLTIESLVMFCFWWLMMLHQLKVSSLNFSSHPNLMKMFEYQYTPYSMDK